MKRSYIYTCVLFLVIILPGCGKNFLNKKQDQNQITPITILDFDAILNAIGNINSPHTLGMIGGEEYISSDARLTRYSGANTYMRDCYLWADDVYGEFSNSNPGSDWAVAFADIYRANLVLDGLKNIHPSPKEKTLYNEVRGRALFMRAYKYYLLAQQYCAPYDAKTVDHTLGLPIRLEADVTIVSQRAQLGDVYRLIEEDLKTAVTILPETHPHGNYVTRSAGYALLAKLYLNMDKYDQAVTSAEECLKRNNQLINLADVTPPSATTVRLFILDHTKTNRGNPEILYYTTAMTASIMTQTESTIAPALLELFETDDLRRTYYFYTHANGNEVYRGSYAAGLYFTGLSTSEVYLIRAEALARLDRLKDAAIDLNKLKEHRFKANAYTPVTFTSKNAALTEIYRERRRELIRRGTRWEDLRRFNKDPEHQVTIKREAFGETHELKPGSLRYVWPIPYVEIWATGMEQNPR